MCFVTFGRSGLVGQNPSMQETKLKTVHWKKLPWLLCGIAVHEAELGRAIARTAMRMFDDEQNMDALITFGRRHPLSQRFLKKNHQLRALLDEFVQGADLATDPNLQPLREWVGALRMIRIVERETEAPELHLVCQMKVLGAVAVRRSQRS